MVAIGLMEVLIVAMVIAGVPGIVWSWVDASKGVFVPVKRSLQVATVLSIPLVPLLVLFGAMPLIVGPFIVFVAAAVCSLLGYLIGPARSMHRRVAELATSETTAPPVETGNPYQPPKS